MIKRRILCAFTFAFAAGCALAQEPAAAPQGLDPSALTKADIDKTTTPAPLLRLAAIYKEKGDLEHLEWTLQRLGFLLPNSGEAKFALAKTYALRDEKAKTYDLLLSMQKQGYAYDVANDPDFAKVATTKVWSYILDRYAETARPTGDGKLAATLPGGDHLYEAIAYDPKRDKLLVGSVRDGKIQLLGKDGKLSDFINPDAGNGLWSVYALAVVPEDDALYVASTSSVYFKEFNQADFGKAGVFKFQLSTGKLLAKYLLAPDAKPRTLSSIAAGKGGLVFVADGLRNVIYRVDGDTLKPTVANPKLTSVRGLALSGDGRKLYFADYALGVFGVDLAAGTGFDLVYDPSKLPLGGVDGLAWYEGTLVAVQSGMAPRRVVRLRLDDDGRTVSRAVILDSGKPEFKVPTVGVVDGDGFYFIANSQRGGYDSYGNPNDASKLEAVKIYRSSLAASWDQAGPGSPPVPGKPPVISISKPGSGKFSNVEGASQSVTGN